MSYAEPAVDRSPLRLREMVELWESSGLIGPEIAARALSPEVSGEPTGPRSRLRELIVRIAVLGERGPKARRIGRNGHSVIHPPAITLASSNSD